MPKDMICPMWLQCTVAYNVVTRDRMNECLTSDTSRRWCPHVEPHELGEYRGHRCTPKNCIHYGPDCKPIDEVKEGCMEETKVDPCSGCERYVVERQECKVYAFPMVQHSKLGGCAMRTHNKPETKKEDPKSQGWKKNRVKK